ncbi:MAG: hypothetical protein DWQ02_10355 [Bacteroidetes bacterium]|nr:MAG: hypothetical protein DWQ02_10355 [Bacteroidota bacterium]
MNLKAIAFCLVTFFSFSNLFAQTHEKGDLLFGFSAGTSFANFTNSKAPQNIHLIGSEDSPVFMPFGLVESSTAYFDYQPDFIRDIKTGIYFGAEAEYFLNPSIALTGAIAYESKGIKVDYANEIEIDDDNTTATYQEVHRRKIANQYLTTTFTLKKHLQHNLFIEGGFYGGMLLFSKFDLYSQKSYYEGPGNNFYTDLTITGKDPEHEFTSFIDLGVSAGFGFQKMISEKMYVKSAMRANIGLLKVDGKYNNEYEETYIPQSANIIALTVRSTNYFGFNSNAKNLNFLFTVGVGWKLQ